MESFVIIHNEEELLNSFDHETGLIIDIRNQTSRSNGSLPKAIQLDLMADNFIEYFSELNKNIPILIYCEDGTRSKIAVRLLKELEFNNLFMIDRGIATWDSVVY